MRLLYVDHDPSVARILHGEFLSYRGVNWNLVHCEDLHAAATLVEQSEFHSVLLRAEHSVDVLAQQLNQLLEVGQCPPVVTVTENLSDDDLLWLISAGSDNSLNRLETTGHEIMRQLRLADSRRLRWNHQLPELIKDSRYEIDASLREIVANHQPSDAIAQWSPQVLLKSTLRIAHVVYGNPLIHQPRKVGNLTAEFVPFSRISDVVDALYGDMNAFDALLIEQSAFEEATTSEFSKLEPFLRLVPSIVLTLEKSDFSALSYVQRGYCDCFVADQLSDRNILHRMQKAILLRRRMLIETLSQQQVGEKVVDRRKSIRDTTNRRRHVRFAMERPIVAIPILPNGAPDIQGRCNANTTDISLGGIGMTLPISGHLPSRDWVVGLEQAGGTMGYVNAYLRRVVYRDHHVEAGLVFQSESNDFFSESNLRPDINADTKHFEGCIGPTALQQWSALGVLTKQLLRRVKVCPECDAICTVGTGCRQCGDFDLDFHDLIHHFACAHVDLSETFERKGEIECPKCLCGGLVVGADFEIIRSRYTCRGCMSQDDYTAYVGNCLQCQLKFPVEIAPEIDVYGYHVERLDILALVDSAR